MNLFHRDEREEDLFKSTEVVMKQLISILIIVMLVTILPSCKKAVVEQEYKTQTGTVLGCDKDTTTNMEYDFFLEMYLPKTETVYITVISLNETGTTWKSESQEDYYKFKESVNKNVLVHYMLYKYYDEESNLLIKTRTAVTSIERIM